MPIPDFLFFTRHRDASLGPAALTAINGSFKNIETNPSLSNETDRDDVASINRVIEFEGDIYWWHDKKIYKRVPESGWALEKDVAITTSDTCKAVWGLHPIVTSDGHQNLVALYYDNLSSDISMIKKKSRFSQNGTWGSEVTFTINAPAAGDDAGVQGWPVVHNNVYYTNLRNNTSLVDDAIAINLDEETLGEISRTTLPTNEVSSSGDVVRAMYPDAWCAYKNEVFHLFREGGNDGSFRNHPSSWAIARYSPALNLSIDLIASGLAPDGSYTADTDRDIRRGRPELFVDNNTGFMYAITQVRPSGTAIWELDWDQGNERLINRQEIGIKVLPAALRLSSGAGNGDMRNRWKAYNLVGPSGEESIMIEFNDKGNSDSLSAFFLWRGPTQRMLYLGAGGNGAMSRSQLKVGGGQSTWSEQQPFDVTCRLSPSGASDGTVKLYSRVLGSGQSVDVSWWFSPSGHAMTTQAEIQNASSGTIVSNVLNGIVANSGEFNVEWKLQDQGVDVGQVSNIHAIASLA